MAVDEELHKEKGVVKAATGVPGFDEIAGGGLPRGETTLILGGPGTGKTVFALQTLVEGARTGEPGIFVTFEEPSRKITPNAAGFGWDLAGLQRRGDLFVLDGQLSSDAVRAGEFDLGGMLVALEAKVASMGARRIVFDSIDVLLTLLQTPEKGNRELRRLQEWLFDMGLVCLVTARMEAFEEARTPQNSFLLFLADCVMLFHYRVVEQRVAVRYLRIVKYRGSAFEQNEFPFSIGEQGIEVGSFGAITPPFPVFTERLATGIERLDTVLGGGYIRGSSILVSGAPGTAKTTLAGAFAQAACGRGEPVLYVGFNETAPEIIRNLSSVNIHLEPCVEDGKLHFYVSSGGARSAEEHLIRIKAQIAAHQPRCLVVDPLSALVRAGGQLEAYVVAQRLLTLAKSLGITLLATSVTTGGRVTEVSKIPISTVTDTWIHLLFDTNGGERNRALTVVKARGTGHSNQVRELILSEEGLTLADVYVSGGAVLMGTLRAEKELEERLSRLRQEAELTHRRQQLEANEAELATQISTLQGRIEFIRSEIELLEREWQLQERHWRERRQTVRDMREADPYSSEGEEGS